MIEAPTRPILRWHGGKWILAPWIISHFPAHKCYVEPFGGAASVLLRKARSYAEVYNDLDGEVVNLFRVAREHGAELRQRLHLTPFSRLDFAESYEPSKDPFPTVPAKNRACRSLNHSDLQQRHPGYAAQGASSPDGRGSVC